MNNFRRQPQDDLRKLGYLKNEDNLKNKENLKNEDNINDEDNSRLKYVMGFLQNMYFLWFTNSKPSKMNDYCIIRNFLKVFKCTNLIDKK